MDIDLLCRTITGGEDSAINFIRWVYPNCQVSDGWARLGSFKGESGSSTVIKIPELAGRDDSTGEKASGPISIIRLAKDCDPKEAAHALREWAQEIGIEVEATEDSKGDAYPWHTAVEAITETDLFQLMGFRGYSLELCLKLKLMSLIGRYKDKWCFPIYNSKGAIVGIDYLNKHKALGGDEQQWISSPKSADRQKSWYSLGANSDADTWVITESRWDGITIFGALSDEELEKTIIKTTSIGVQQTEIKIPSRVKKVIVARQNDDASFNWAEQIASRVLPSTELYVASPTAGTKDYNDVLREHGIEIVKQLIAEAPRCSTRNGKLTSDSRPTLLLPGDYVEAPAAAAEAYRLMRESGMAYNVRNQPYKLIVGQEPELLDSKKLIYLLQDIAVTTKLFRGSKDELQQDVALPSARQTDLILASGFHKKYLERVEQVLEHPQLLKVGGKLEVLDNGYHETDIGGVFILNNDDPLPDVAFDYALDLLTKLIQDFRFQAESDRSRFLALLIAPALQTAGLLRGQYPIGLIQAIEQGSGKSSLMELIPLVYNETAASAAPRNTKKQGGVGSFDASLSAAILKGKRFVVVDNQRGMLDSPLLESAVTQGEAQVRATYAAETVVKTNGTIFLITANNAEMTPDLVERCVVVNLRGKPAKWSMEKEEWKELVREYQPVLLASIYAIIREWHRQGCPSGDSTPHRFRDWSAPLCGMLEKTCELPALFDDGHLDKDEITNPQIVWLKKVAIEVKRRRQTGVAIRSAQIADVCKTTAVQIPGSGPSSTPVQRAKDVGNNISLLVQEKGPTIRVGPFLAELGKRDFTKENGARTRDVWSILITETEEALS
jgi:hypothetical protein